MKKNWILRAPVSGLRSTEMQARAYVSLFASLSHSKANAREKFLDAR